MSNTALAQKLPEPKTSRNADQFNMLGLLRISDEEHFRRAVFDANPHTYLMDSMGMENKRGEDGLGFFNAVDLHVTLILGEHPGISYLTRNPQVKAVLAQRQPSAQDLEAVDRDIAFNSALEKIGYKNLPAAYQKIIGHDECAERHKVATAEYAR